MGRLLVYILYIFNIMEKWIYLLTMISSSFSDLVGRIFFSNSSSVMKKYNFFYFI